MEEEEDGFLARRDRIGEGKLGFGKHSGVWSFKIPFKILAPSKRPRRIRIMYPINSENFQRVLHY